LKSPVCPLGPDRNAKARKNERNGIITTQYQSDRAKKPFLTRQMSRLVQRCTPVPGAGQRPTHPLSFQSVHNIHPHDLCPAAKKMTKKRDRVVFVICVCAAASLIRTNGQMHSGLSHITLPDSYTCIPIQASFPVDLQVSLTQAIATGLSRIRSDEESITDWLATA
jgi:hypothetical protein